MGSAPPGALDLPRFADAPLAEAFARLVGPLGRTLVLAGALVSMSGYVSGDMLGSPRTLFAFARDGILPAALARVHARFHTPHLAFAIQALIVWLATSLGSFGELALISNVAILSLYLLCCAGAFELARRDVRSDGAPFRFPCERAVPLLGCAAIVAIPSSATLAEWRVEAVVLALASAAYGLRRRRAGSLATAGSPLGARRRARLRRPPAGTRPPQRASGTRRTIRPSASSCGGTPQASKSSAGVGACQRQSA